MIKSLSVVLLVLCAIEISAQNKPRTKRGAPREVVFVCEHGAALSLISAAYFNKLAKEQHLNLHAVARGVTPQEELSPQALKGLKSDGLAPEIEQPLGLSQEDLNKADRVVTFLPLPDQYTTKSPVENWSDVAWGPGSYQQSRDGILKHVQEMLTKLKAGTKTP